ncbi:DISARM system SNF2-like helicase DrmD [Nocardiopsis sp. JB363]|uniref:DISARM system SNF2-like helicase DrmD n=1 Tax=Nocardiopsis sp. JB363 TaxID=1434837 RepID=UPI00097A9414|nr:DISARM system SNF2-like helicase DrmD [Nocardiopsis sp. JB363]SIO90586.1 helicase-like [Nocardiopsis sp. JB363]
MTPQTVTDSATDIEVLGPHSEDSTDGSATPVPGTTQMVTVRNRPWVVSQVRASPIVSSDGTRITGKPQHMVSLVSIGDDASNDRIEVLWELEVGTRIHEGRDLPAPADADGFDSPVRLDAFLHAVRWGAITSADSSSLQAPFRSGIEIEDYQLEPVVRALSMPRTNLLIADDVGLGKTIEAGLVMQELQLRHRARNMLIVCPAGLTTQWRDEMRDKFGLDFRVVDAELVRGLRRERGLYANPWTHYPRLIVSVDWLKRERPRRMLREILPANPRYPRAIDLLVVDEAHNVAPAGSGKYAVDSLRTKAIRELAPHCEHRLFLSATPHNGYPESFSALLELLDDQRFARGIKPSDEQLDRAMVRRLKRDLPKRWDGSARFPERVLGYAEVDYDEAERRAHRTLVEYADSRRLRVGRPGRHTVDFVTTLLKKRLFSSPQAFARTVTTHLSTMDAKGAAQEPSTGMAEPILAQEILPVLRERLTETSEHEEEYQEAEVEVLGTVSRGTPGLTDHERGLLTDLRSWAQGAQGRSDARFAALRSWLDPVLFRPGVDGEPLGPQDPAGWTDERVIIFTEYRDTQRWLRERLITAGYGGKNGERLAQLYGGQDSDEREQVKNVFTDRPDLDKVRILVATDSASEGINLQRYCHRILHWEIPWNPNRLEQRNGRVDRHGQRAGRVEITHFVPKGWETAEPGSLEDELGFLRTAAEKVDRIREDLGSAGDVIAHQVEQKMLGRRTEWTETDSEISSLAGVARLRTQHELNHRVKELANKLTGSRDRLDLTPDTLERVVRTGLDLAHRKDLIDAEAPKDVTAKCFRLPELAGAWASARNGGLAHPVTGVERLVTFDPDAVVGRNDLVLLHLKHRLVDLCLTLLREELWSQGSKLSRVTARVVESDVLKVPAVVAHGRVVVTGAEGTRLHEEVLLAGGRIDQGSFARAKEEEIDRWMAAASERLAPEPVRERLVQMWPDLDKAVGGALQQRAGQRFKAVQRDLDRKREQEVEAIGLVLDELAEGIEAALDDTPRWEQTSLFELREKEQLRQDREALQARLKEIPERKKEEQEALKHRYDKPKPRWFPVAVTFLVPAAVKR